MADKTEHLYTIEDLARTLEYWELTTAPMPPKEPPTEKEISDARVLREYMDKHGY